MRAVRAWRPTMLDIGLAAGLSVAGVALMIGNVVDEETAAPVVAVPAIVAVTAPLIARSTAPVGALLASLAALGAHVALFGTMVRCSVAFPTVLLLAFAAAARCERRDATAALVLAVAFVVVAVPADDVLGGWADVPGFSVLVAVIWGIGRVVHSRSKLGATLAAHTSELQRARDERSRLEVAADRERLSRELDALLQERLAELTRLADSAPQDPTGATSTLRSIEARGRATLDEMREIVGVLRGDEDQPGAAREPLPSLVHLEALVLRHRGPEARLVVRGDPRVLPAGVELSAYRIVEHLLTAYDGGSGVLVDVHFGSDALELEVTGPARRMARSAVERARERAQLHRGSLQTTGRDGQTAVVARLPLLAG